MHVKAKDFLAKYSCLAAKDPTPLPADPKQAVASILRSLHLPETEWQIGKTKVQLPLHAVLSSVNPKCRSVFVDVHRYTYIIWMHQVYTA